MAIKNWEYFTAVARLGRRVTIHPGGRWSSNHDPATAEYYSVNVGSRAGKADGVPVLDLSFAELHALHTATGAALAAHAPVPSGWLSTAHRKSTDFLTADGPPPPPGELTGLATARMYATGMATALADQANTDQFLAHLATNQVTGDAVTAATQAQELVKAAAAAWNTVQAALTRHVPFDGRDLGSIV